MARPRKRNGEGAAFFGGTPDGDVATVSPRERQRQAQTQPIPVFRATPIAAVEPLKNTRQFIRRYSNARILDR